MTNTSKAPTAVKMAIRTAIILFIFVIVFTAFLSGAYLWTKPALEASAAEEKMKLISEVLPRSAYDNDLLKDTLKIAPSSTLGLDEPSTVYRARKGGQASAVVLEAVAPDGYSGKIRLLVAINLDGTLAGVRVTQHKETPGLGDYIEPKKDKNKTRPWITQFDGLSLVSVSDREWKVKKDGGRFDSVVGATVTPRAVIKAVRKATQYVAENREQLYATK
jgi:electron transport complex protein RnfG